MITVRLPGALIQLLEYDENVIETSGPTVEKAIADLCRRRPELSPHFFNASGNLKDHPWSFFKNGEEVSGPDEISDGDRLEVLAGMSGGVGKDDLRPEEVRQYARHLSLPAVGRAGQLKLKNSHVVLVGAGGLGSPVALYLAAAGVGRITVIDPDSVEPSNLQRQVAHGMLSVGEPKALSAKERMSGINPYIEIDAVVGALADDNADNLIASCDVIIDGTDNFETRLLVNRVSRKHGKPFVFGAVHQFDGHVAVFNSGPDAPCFRCLFPTLPTGDLAPNCAAGGVLGVVPGIVGIWQAAETVKLLLGIGNPLAGRLLAIDVLDGSSRELRFSRKSNCPACSDSAPSEHDTQVTCSASPSVTPLAPRHALAAPDFQIALESEDVLLIDVREPGELEICQLARATNIPLRTLPSRIDDLEPDRSYLLFCKSGGRSGQAVAQLLGAGFTDVRHLDGGLLAWAREIDSEMVVV